MNPNIGEPDTELKSQTSLEIGQILPLFLLLCFMHKDPSLLPLKTHTHPAPTGLSTTAFRGFLKGPCAYATVLEIAETKKSGFMLKPTGGNITAVQMLLSAP